MAMLNSAPTASGSVLALLVDPNDDTRLMYREYFTQSGIEVDDARDGREALAKALLRRHDVIVTETRVPGINGYELCQLLRRDNATRTTPILVVTGDALDANRTRALKAGADAVLFKPCLPDELLIAIRHQVRRAVELRQRSQALHEAAVLQATRASELKDRVLAADARSLSRTFRRADTTTPPAPPPSLRCPSCDHFLTYQRSHVGGVSERHREQWDYFQCANGCGTFQYRQRTRKLRQVS